MDPDNQYKWIKPILKKKDYPDYPRSIISTKSNFVHFITPRKGKHCKIHLADILPSNIYNKYVKRNDNVVYNDDDDMKSDEYDKLKEKLKIVEAEKKSLQTLTDDVLSNQSKLEN